MMYKVFSQIREVNIKRHKEKWKIIITTRYALLYYLPPKYVGRICFLNYRAKKKKTKGIYELVMSAWNSMKLGLQHHLFLWHYTQTENSNICNLCFQFPQAVWQYTKNYSHQ